MTDTQNIQRLILIKQLLQVAKHYVRKKQEGMLLYHPLINLGEASKQSQRECLTIIDLLRQNRPYDAIYHLLEFIARKGASIDRKEKIIETLLRLRP